MDNFRLHLAFMIISSFVSFSDRTNNMAILEVVKSIFE